VKRCEIAVRRKRMGSGEAEGGTGGERDRTGGEAGTKREVRPRKRHKMRKEGEC